MADSTADFTKKILVDVEIKSEQVKKDIPVLTDLLDKYNEELKTLKASQKDLDTAGQKNSTTYRNNTKDIVETTQSIRQLKTDIRDANKYIDNASKAINSETGSIQQNRAVLSLVTSDYVKLGQVEGQTAEQTLKLATDVNNLTDKLKDQEKQIGQTYRNVGNYTDSINKSKIATGAASSSIQDLTKGADNLRKGMGFLPQAFTNMSGAGGAAYQVLQTSITGFNTVIKDNSRLQQDAAAAAKILAEAEEVLAVATAEAAAAEKAQADGILSDKAAQMAKVELTEAQTAVTEAQTAAQIANTAVTESGSIGIAGLIGSILGVIAVIGAVATWFAKLTPNAESLKQTISGLGGAYDAFMSDLGEGVGFITLFKDMGEAYRLAKELTVAMQDLTRQAEITAVANANADTKIADLQLKMRNRRNTPEQEKQYFDQIQNISNVSYKMRKAQADAEYDIAVRNATIGRKFTDDEIKQVRDKGVVYAAFLDKTKGLRNNNGAGTDVAAIAKAQEDQAAAERYQETIQQRAQNRLDQNQMKAEARAQVAAQNAIELKAKKEQAAKDSDNILQASLAKQLKDLYESYGDQAIAADEQYRTELSKLQKYRDKHLITIEQYNIVEAQLSKTHNSDISKIISDFQDKDYDAYKKADNELRQLQIASIDEDLARSIAGLKEKGIQQADELDRQNEQYDKVISQLNNELLNKDSKFNDDELAEIRQRIIHEQTLIDENSAIKKRKAYELNKEIDKINKAALDQQNKIRDSNDVNEAKTKFGGNSSQLLAAKQQQLLDNYNAEVTQEGLTAAAKLEIERKYLADKDSLDNSNKSERMQSEIDFAQQVATSAFNFISQGLQQESDARLAAIDASKAAELNNASLTNTQKQLIEAKYQKKENAEKVKAFKANQKLSVAEALINGALAITKATSQTGILAPFVIPTIIASTVGSIALILSQKAPAFAKGGEFVSDGRGAAIPGYSRHDNMNARLRSGEGVVVSEAMRAPWARNMISDINVAFGGRSFSSPGHQKAFATGGIFTDGGNSNRFYSQPVVNAGELANTLAYQLINNFPPIYTDVKDVINQIGIRTQTDDRVIL